MKNNKYRIYGFFLYCVLKIISKTMKIEVIKNSKVFPEDGCVCGFWHNKLIGVSIGLPNFAEKKAVLASPSKDGELISVPLEKMGYTTVRGSSGKDSVKAVLTLIRLIQEGYVVGTPLDGPKGPIYKVKPGMLYLAKKSGHPIVPIGIGFSSKWVFKKTWDKFQLPKPFSKMMCIVGDPIFIPSDSELDDYLDIVRDSLLELDEEAAKILKKR